MKAIKIYFIPDVIAKLFRQLFFKSVHCTFTMYNVHTI